MSDTTAQNSTAHTAISQLIESPEGRRICLTITAAIEGLPHGPSVENDAAQREGLLRQIIRGSPDFDIHRFFPLYRMFVDKFGRHATIKAMGAGSISGRASRPPLLVALILCGGTLEEISSFVESGIDLDITQALQAAPYMDRRDVVSYLLNKGADINARDETGFTPLMRAASSGSYEVADFLISKGADVNALGLNYETALTESIGHHLGIAKLLLANGADPNEGSPTPMTTALDDLYNFGSRPIERLYPNNSAGLILQLDKINKAVKLLLENGANPNQKIYVSHDENITPLMVAALAGDSETFMRLLSAGADTSALDRSGMDVFDYASSNFDPDHLEYRAKVHPVLKQFRERIFEFLKSGNHPRKKPKPWEHEEGNPVPLPGG